MHYYFLCLVHVWIFVQVGNVHVYVFPCIILLQMFNGYGDLLYHFSMVDKNEKAHIDKETAEGVAYIKKKDYYHAFLVRIKWPCSCGMSLKLFL